MILADKITALRKQNGWSQEELAHQLDVSRQAVSKWESASAIPDLDRILKMSQLFDVSTDYLLKEELENETPNPVSDDRSENALRRVSLEEARDFLKRKHEGARPFALAIAAYVLSPELLIFLAGYSELKSSVLTENMAGILGMVVLLLIVAAATAVVIMTGFKMTKYEYLEKEDFELQYGVEDIVCRRKDEFEDTFRKCIAFGVVLCIVSVVPLLIAVAFETPDITAILCINFLLLMVAVAVYLFVWSGIEWGACQMLLQEGDYTSEKKAEARSALAPIYWCLITAVYLGVSFYTGAWHRSWIIWPCAGVLFVAVQGIAGIIRQNKKKNL